MRYLTLKPGNNRFAFTLVELIVAMTIFSVVALGLGASFLSGMKLWSKANQSFSSGKAEFFLEVFARDIYQCLNLEQVGFSGTKEEVSFPALLYGRVVKVTYSFDKEGKKLKRSTVNLKDALSKDSGSLFDKEESLQAANCELSYFSFDAKKEKYFWAESWDKKNSIFSGVRIKFSYEGNEFSKTLFLPVS